MNISHGGPILKILPLVGAALLAGCASSVPKAQVDASVPVPYLVKVDDKPSVSIENEGAVLILPDERQHLQGLVVAKLDMLRARNAASGEPRECAIIVTMTRFDKGNAFARAMLAGLGQIHLAANVRVTDQSGSALQSFKVEKTFAWGGIYGASTRIDDVEPAFADAIAEELTGQSTQPPDSKHAQKNASQSK